VLGSGLEVNESLINAECSAGSASTMKKLDHLGRCRCPKELHHALMGL
jgi:hypothetical protein